MPAPLQVLAMVDRDAIEPGTNPGLSSERIHLPVRLEKHIMSGVLRLVWIAQKTKRQVEDALRMLLVNRTELARYPRWSLKIWRILLALVVSHYGLHQRLD